VSRLTCNGQHGTLHTAPTRSPTPACSLAQHSTLLGTAQDSANAKTFSGTAHGGLQKTVPQVHTALVGVGKMGKTVCTVNVCCGSTPLCFTARPCIDRKMCGRGGGYDMSADVILDAFHSLCNHMRYWEPTTCCSLLN
jgi:hypothetical protein